MDNHDYTIRHQIVFPPRSNGFRLVADNTAMSYTFEFREGGLIRTYSGCRAKQVGVDMVIDLTEAASCSIDVVTLWRSMDTAPKDGTVVLGTDGTSVAPMKWVTTASRFERGKTISFWTTEEGSACCSSLLTDLAGDPTGWQHLPKPMKRAEGDNTLNG